MDSSHLKTKSFRAIVLLFILFAGGIFAVPARAGSSNAAHLVTRGTPIEARAFLFNVPYYHQEHALSCEVASLRSALAGIGIDIAERNLWRELPKDLTPKKKTSTGTVWGNPNAGFVGNVNGRMPATGYGVFIGPLMKTASLHAKATEIRVDNGRAIDAALSERHPIIVWTEIGPLPTHSYQWKTRDGIAMTVPAYEHTVVLVGYRGTTDAIEGVYLVDPLKGLRYEPWSEFLTRTAPFGHVGIEIGGSW